jgi:hypothetical protein
VESREATLGMNPDFLQLNNGPKLYFDATRNTIHFDVSSLYSTSLYFDRNMPVLEHRVTSPIDMLQINASRRRRNLVRNLKGFSEIRNLSLPPPIHYVSFAIVELFFGSQDAVNAFGKVERIVSKSIPNTIQSTDIWENYMKEEREESLSRHNVTQDSLETMHMLRCWASYSRLMWHNPISRYRWTPSEQEEIERLKRLFEMSSS